MKVLRPAEFPLPVFNSREVCCLSFCLEVVAGREKLFRGWISLIKGKLVFWKKCLQTKHAGKGGTDAALLEVIHSRAATTPGARALSCLFDLTFLWFEIRVNVNTANLLTDSSVCVQMKPVRPTCGTVRTEG